MATQISEFLVELAALLKKHDAAICAPNSQVTFLKNKSPTQKKATRVRLTRGSTYISSHDLENSVDYLLMNAVLE